MNISIITARGGSKSILNKNVFEVAGKPLVAYPIEASLGAASVSEVYVSTDCEMVAAVAREKGCRVIDRPESLQGDDVNHGDVIKHAVEAAEADFPELENVALLLGNTVMVDGGLIDRAMRALAEEPDIDSVMSVWEAADDHPLRAMEIHDGLLRPYGDPNRSVSTNRQSYPSAYYYDQGVWAFRKYTVQERTGPNPWWWMGRRCKPIIRSWVTGRDIHAMLDVALAEWWVKHADELKDLEGSEA